MTAESRETLRHWHCASCGYANVGYDPCAGCHRPAPRAVRANTRVSPRPVPQTELAAALVDQDAPPERRRRSGPEQ